MIFSNEIGSRILAALGIEGRSVRRLDCRLTVGEPVVVETEELVTRDAAERLAGELESREYYLVESKWIPSESLKPERPGVYWVRSPRGVFLARMSTWGVGGWGERHSWVDIEDRVMIVPEPTHWMPISKPPFGEHA